MFPYCNHIALVHAVTAGNGIIGVTEESSEVRRESTAYCDVSFVDTVFHNAISSVKGTGYASNGRILGASGRSFDNVAKVTASSYRDVCLYGTEQRRRAVRAGATGRNLYRSEAGKVLDGAECIAVSYGSRVEVGVVAVVLSVEYHF